MLNKSLDVLQAKVTSADVPLVRSPTAAEAFFEANPDIEVLEAFVIDVNGVPRGKWIPRERALEVLVKGMAMPRSVYALDVWGRDVNAAGLAEGTGDPDGLCMPVPGTLSRVNWLNRATAQVMLDMRNVDGSDFQGNPRSILAGVLARYAKLKLTPVAATELEFYLIDPVRSSIPSGRPNRARAGGIPGRRRCFRSPNSKTMRRCLPTLPPPAGLKACRRTRLFEKTAPASMKSISTTSPMR